MKQPGFLSGIIFCLFSAVTLAGSAAAITVIDYDAVPPVVSFQGTRGLTQVSSGEAQGAGRMTFNLMGAWYRQQNALPGTRDVGANIGAGTFAFSFGANDYIEMFATLSAFGSTKYPNTHNRGLGSISAGVQGTAPLPENSPIHLGAQAIIIGGTSKDQVNSNYADGFNYHQTRTGYDILGRAIQSLVLGDDAFGFKLMLNQAFSTSVQKSQSNLMMLGGGIQAILAYYSAIGLELNSRTYFDDINLRTDPLWLTPSITVRGPFHLGMSLGADIALSKERHNDPAHQALEPFRLFASTTLSMDVLARKRNEELARQRRQEEERAALAARTEQLSTQMSELEQKARQDSIAKARVADSLAQVAAQLAQKARADSLALVESRKKLEEERSKRSDMETQLLSTGMLVLDAVYFESGRTDISLNSRPYLTIIAKMLTKYPKLKLEVGGHTDSRGGIDLNTRLSRNRAEKVRLFLISIEPNLVSRLTATGYGPTVPKAPNTTAAGRQINHRVELSVTNKEVLKEYNP